VIVSVESIGSNSLKPNLTNACSRHFPAVDNSNDPQINFIKQFASPVKQKLPRAKRAKARNSRRDASIINSAPNDVTPLPAPVDTIPLRLSLTVATGEQFCIDYSVQVTK